MIVIPVLLITVVTMSIFVGLAILLGVLDDRSIIVQSVKTAPEIILPTRIVKIRRRPVIV